MTTQTMQEPAAGERVPDPATYDPVALKAVLVIVFDHWQLPVDDVS